MESIKVKVLMYNNEFADIQPNGNIIKIPFPKIFNTIDSLDTMKEMVSRMKKENGDVAAPKEFFEAIDKCEMVEYEMVRLNN